MVSSGSGRPAARRGAQQPGRRARRAACPRRTSPRSPAGPLGVHRLEEAVMPVAGEVAARQQGGEDVAFEVSPCMVEDRLLHHEEDGIDPVLAQHRLLAEVADGAVGVVFTVPYCERSGTEVMVASLPALRWKAAVAARFTSDRPVANGRHEGLAEQVGGNRGCARRCRWPRRVHDVDRPAEVAALEIVEDDFLAVATEMTKVGEALARVDVHHPQQDRLAAHRHHRHRQVFGEGIGAGAGPAGEDDDLHRGRSRGAGGGPAARRAGVAAARPVGRSVPPALVRHPNLPILSCRCAGMPCPPAPKPYCVTFRIKFNPWLERPGIPAARRAGTGLRRHGRASGLDDVVGRVVEERAGRRSARGEENPAT